MSVLFICAILAQNDPFFDCSEKDPGVMGTAGMKNSLSPHEQHTRPNSPGNRPAEVATWFFVCVCVVLLVAIREQSLALSWSLLKMSRRDLSAGLSNWP